MVTLPAMYCELHKMIQVPERTLEGCGVACSDSCSRIYCELFENKLLCHSSLYRYEENGCFSHEVRQNMKFAYGASAQTAGNVLHFLVD